MDTPHGTPEVVFSCCNDSYHRGVDGIWRYDWGEVVPGASDLTVAAALSLRVDPAAPRQVLSRDELAFATSLCGVDRPLMVPLPGGGRQLVVGIVAPELNILAMMTVSDIGEVAGVSKATIDSYRYRGYLPEPQVVKGRTPLWTRPIVAHWLAHRPGSGWRTDVYGTRSRTGPDRSMPIARARARLARQAAGALAEGTGR